MIFLSEKCLTCIIKMHQFTISMNLDTYRLSILPSFETPPQNHGFHSFNSDVDYNNDNEKLSEITKIIGYFNENYPRSLTKSDHFGSTLYDFSTFVVLMAGCKIYKYSDLGSHLFLFVKLADVDNKIYLTNDNSVEEHINRDILWGPIFLPIKKCDSLKEFVETRKKLYSKIVVELNSLFEQGKLDKHSKEQDIKNYLTPFIRSTYAENV